MNPHARHVVAPLFAAFFVIQFFFGLLLCVLCALPPGGLANQPWLRAAALFLGVTAMTPALVVDLALRACKFDSVIAQHLFGGMHPAAFFGRLPRREFLFKLWATARFIASQQGYPISLRVRGYAFVAASMGSIVALMACIVALVIVHGGA
jgi:hypothetical protein